jgi:hypothetical protein
MKEHNIKRYNSRIAVISSHAGWPPSAERASIVDRRFLTLHAMTLNS